jgi:MYXO-CTERM domain-containing protein
MNVRLHITGAASLALAVVLVGACVAPPSDSSSSDEAPVGAASSALHVRADGLLPGMKAWRGGKQITANPVCANPQLSYFGGPVIQTPVIVPVFWNSTVNASVQASLPQFYADVTVSSYWPWLEEYDTVGRTPGTNQAILAGKALPGVVIAPLQCNPGGNNCALTDAQLQAELARQITLGVLPAPVLDCTGNVETIYMVHFPANVSLRGPGNIRSCANGGFGGFCAYHNTGTVGPTATPLIYGVVMDHFTGGCATGCGADGNALDDTTDTASHELVEAATDPDVGLDTQTAYAFPAGWGDNNNCGEVADICDDGSAGDTITVSGRSWRVQQSWSNAQHRCTSSGTPPAVCAGTTVTGCRKCSCGDDGAACGGARPVCETNAANVLFGACEACTSTHEICANGTCLQSTTPAQDDICSCTPATTCPAGDDCGSVSDGCGGMITCGACTLPATCGGAGNPNQCGCTPATTCPAGDDCGVVPDLCGGVVSCGTCTAPATCGGGTPSDPNRCGCTPLTACPAGDVCGLLPDGCGAMLSCGACQGTEMCVANQCVPMTTAASSSSSIAASSSAATGTGGASSSSATGAGGASSSSATGAGGASSSSATGAGGASSSSATGAGGASSSSATSAGGASSSSATGAGGASSSSATSAGGASSSSATGAGGASSSSAAVGSGGALAGSSSSSSAASSASSGAGEGGSTGADGATGGSDLGGGCGCEVAGAPRTSTSALAALGLLALAALRRRRHARAADAASS